MVKQQLLEDIKKAVEELDYPTTDIVLSIPKNPQFGDYTMNLALQLAKVKLTGDKQSPREIADEIVTRVKNLESSKKYLARVEVAGAGFINFFIKDEQLLKNTNNLDSLPKSKTSKKILVEYGHVNPLKEIHIGHLRTFILGESLSRILEALDNQVFRANYQGDIGLHIAKAIWGIEQLGLPTGELNLEEKAQFLGKAYAKGNTVYEEDPNFKKEIDQINVRLYQKDPNLQEIYILARTWSLEYFEPIYVLLGVKYDALFFESEVFERGKQIVFQNIGKVFEENNGAVIFPGEKYGLHTRVFVTSAGNPTYEGKDMGLAEAEYKVFNYDNSIHVVASEQEGYFRVIIKAIELLFPYLKGKKYHLSYGLVDLKEGKMSSRTGNVVTVDDLVSVVSEKVREIIKSNRLEVDQTIVKQVALGAIKFAYLKFSPRPNMVFDLEESVSLDGDSGPYIQYTHARIQSVLKKSTSGESKPIPEVKLAPDKLERLVLRHLIYFPEAVEEAASQSHPNLIATYLLELSRLYNLFYQECRIIGSEKEAFRLKLSGEVGKVLKKGLYLLGIESPERM
ncbi:arginine--tRNA ligase [Candidatus Daviesbacteria bacterium RIFCSPHIGHO2_02_FULL_39_12]|uniref:Arginine--tRNA ligase n=2 Tax=Candidatus Daviesiibacteriota TaxID=1752718 RepID=A0A1F5JAG7_9BACT|nr:MAG: arginine--tRNA ligase [Candidatus Daviesbacteria bacterium RIFCSPHIGHO2_02_FULL_39_12]OGE72816.1 MAG: arginine--tRNA ligase [Candidatus Daviesbacteria bacterium RIFCSPLOWO2_02_FULL_38_15]